MPVKLNSSGGGSVTLDLGSTGSTYTQTLPLVNGSLVAADSGGNVSVSGNVNVASKLNVGLNSTINNTTGYAVYISGGSLANSAVLIESTASTVLPQLYFNKPSTTLRNSDFQGAITWNRTLTNSATMSSSIFSFGSNDASAPAMNLYYNAYTSHVFTTGNNDPKFLIGTNGQLGFLGANYGSSGQVLVSGGASAAPSWASAINSATAITTTTTSFTGATIGVSSNLIASSVTGTIQIGQVITGTGIPAGGSTIVAFQSGVNGGAGTYSISPASTGTVSGTITVVGVDFWMVPSWAKRITVLLNTVSGSGTSALQIQVGAAGTVYNTGYTCAAGAINGGTGQLSSTTGLLMTIAITAASNQTGRVVLDLIGNNTWVSSGTVLYTASAGAIVMSTGVTPVLSAFLDRIRVTTVNGTDTFDAGSINILYE